MGLPLSRFIKMKNGSSLTLRPLSQAAIAVTTRAPGGGPGRSGPSPVHHTERELIRDISRGRKGRTPDSDALLLRS